MTVDDDDEKKIDVAEIEVLPDRHDVEEPHDVWGELEDGGPNYRGLGWIRASVLLTKIQIGLGVLAIPQVLHTLGFVPGLLVILLVAFVATWSNYIVGMFKLAHPSVYTLADVGGIIWGPVGREVLGGAYWIYMTFGAGAGLIGISTAFNAMSDHALCTAIFVFIGAVINFIIASIQTLDKISFIGWVGVIGIFASVITLSIAVGIQERPSAAPPTGPWDKGIVIVGDVSFVDGMSALANIVFAFAGTPAFFNVVSEMKEPRHYFKAMYLTQITITVVYIVIGSIVYHFCGQYVSSPALGSAGITFKKVCYGLALPGLIVSAVLNTHMPAKYLFVRLMHKSQHFTKNTPTHYIVWYGLVFITTALSFVIAESIPIFGDLLSFVGAFFSTPLVITIEAYMYFWQSRRQNPAGYMQGYRKIVHIVNWTIIVLSIFCWGGGTAAAIILIKDHVKAGSKGTPFSCADNSK